MPDVGIISSLTKLPLGLLSPRLDNAGPYGPGNHAMTTWTDGSTVRNVSDTFGVVLQLSGSIPSHVGRTFGFDDGVAVNLDEFDDRVVQVAVLHQLLSGAWVADQVLDAFYLPQLARWAEDLPGKIGLYVAPNFHVDLFYLVTV